MPKLVCWDNKLVYFITGVINSGFNRVRFRPVTACFNLRLGFCWNLTGPVGLRINLSLGFLRMAVLTYYIISDEGKATYCKDRWWLTFYLVVDTNFFGIPIDVLEAVLLTVVCCFGLRLPVWANLFLRDQDWFDIRVQINRVNINVHQTNSIIWIPLNTWRIPTRIA